MKKIIYIFIMTAGFAACKGKKTDLDTNKEMVTLSDPAYTGSYLTDTGAVANTDAYTGGEVVSGKATVPEANNPPRNSGNSGGSYGSGSGSSSQGSSASAGTGTTAEKKGISKAAKGAIIGGVGGAVAGAVVSKKKGKGAIIGGVVGAAGGYIIGRNKDKKDGRY